MTPRDEHVKSYVPKEWRRSYNGFSGVDFAVEKNGEIYPGMQIQGISYGHDGTASIIFTEEDGTLWEGDSFLVYLKASNSEGVLMVKKIVFKLLEPMVLNQVLKCSWSSESNWSRP